MSSTNLQSTLMDTIDEMTVYRFALMDIQVLFEVYEDRPQILAKKIKETLENVKTQGYEL